MVYLIIILLFLGESVLNFSNSNWQAIITPVNADIFKILMREADKDEQQIEFLVSGFKQGFDTGYCGPTQRRHTSRNLPFRIGTPLDLWNKVMKEVEAKCYAGPFTESDLPFQNFIQSPLGLVPKAGGIMRLIFHLSYNFSDNETDNSINFFIPDDLCSVH